MPTREEINRILDRLKRNFISIHETKVALAEQGVVIKVERDLVNTTSETEDIKSKLHKAVDAHINNETTFIKLMSGIVEAGYVAVEPLIGEK